MQEYSFLPEEQEAANFMLGWAKSYNIIRIEKNRKLIRVITPYDEKQYYTLLTDPKPRIIFHETVSFVVTVQDAKDECHAGHKPGDRWEFSWCTPAGMCSSAYHAMYPVLHGLMLTSDRYDGPAAQETHISCPDRGWLTFHIERHRWMPEDWEHCIAKLEEIKL
jgi:uncharacterized repeat protein (TIGR04076 family)